MELEQDSQISNDMESDDAEFSDEQKNENYQRIVDTINFIQSGGKITEDWMDEERHYIYMYRSWIPDYSMVNPERETAEFRKVCHETETLIQYLLNYLKNTGHVEVKVYLMLLQHMRKIIDSIREEDELDDLMNGLAM